MTSLCKSIVMLGLVCVLGACAGKGREARPDLDPLEADRPATTPSGQKPVAPVMTR